MDINSIYSELDEKQRESVLSTDRVIAYSNWLLCATAQLAK